MSDPVPIIACSRPEGRVAQLLRDLDVATTLLPLGIDWRPLPDRYLLGEDRIAERLTTAQFSRAIVARTLFRSALDLRATVGGPVFVIEGEGFEGPGQVHPNAVRGALSALIVEYGVSVLRTADPPDSAALLALMARHAQFGVPEISLAAKRKADSPADEQRRVVEMLPGVGFTLARRLLQHFGSLARLLTAGPDALSQVPGVGRRTAAAIAELLRREYCAVDSEADLEEVLAERAELLLEGSATLLARQHLFRDREGRRLVADLIFVDDAQQTVFLVEIKRGALRQEDVRQLAAYLDAAEHSPLLRAYVERGYAMRGLLAAPESQLTGTEDERVAVRLVEAEEAAAELMRRRLRRLGEADGEA